MNEEALSFLPIAGVRLAAVPAGVKYRDRNDMVVIELAEGGSCAAVFTRNQFCAAPVTLAHAHLSRATPRYLLINSGNANAGTGKRGLQDAATCCEAMGRAGACAADRVLPFSTGVIGEPLPVDRLVAAMPRALESLDPGNWAQAARAIMTTDTVPKLVSRELQIGGVKAAVTGMAKGSGMIRPDMATMLAYIATDLPVAPAVLQAVLTRAVDPSFNAITVDGDTSTNDACVLMASGAVDVPLIDDVQSEAAERLAAVVLDVCMELATAIVRDGEGATKLVRIEVAAAADRDEARQVAYTIAHSPLVKTALFASDPNWGRILAAVGRAGLTDLDIERVEIRLDDVCIVRDGGRADDYTEEAGRGVLGKSEFTIGVRLGRGGAEASVLTCDLSYDYVRINAEYRS